MANVYFELTEAFNAVEPTVVLASGQAAVFYRVAIMSKDGDWVIREAPEACDRVLRVLEARNARYRPSAPLDIRWLAGGWSSHFEFFDERHRRVRCDFVSRPPRVSADATAAWFDPSARAPMRVVDVESLIRMKQTQRAKDYAVIGALATLVAPDAEVRLTTDPDRLLALAVPYGHGVDRAAVRAALTGDRRAVVLALAAEADDLQQSDRRRVERYERAAEPYLAACRTLALETLNVREAHTRLCAEAARLLPARPPGDAHVDAE